MHGKYLVFDIEAIPWDRAMEILPFEPEPFEPEPVKLGNLKDPEKIAAKIAEHETRENERCASLALKNSSNYDAHYSAMAMHPSQAQIVNIGVFDGQRYESLFVYPDPHEFTEASALEKFWMWAIRYENLITFNGMRYDVPLIEKRCLVNRVDIMRDIPCDPYRIKWHYDLYAILNKGQRGKGGLDYWAKVLGISEEGKGGMKGDQVWKLYQAGKYSEIERYCENDCRMEWQLFERMIECGMIKEEQ